MKRDWLAGVIVLGTVAATTPSVATTIDFNEPFPAPFTFACTELTNGDVIPCYVEDGMTFKPLVYNHYHLSPENPDDISFPIPDDTPRLLNPHAGDAEIRMTYDPEGDGVLNPFDLLSLDLKGSVSLRIGNIISSIPSFNQLSPGNSTNSSFLDPTGEDNFEIEKPIIAATLSSPQSISTQILSKNQNLTNLLFVDLVAKDVFSIDNINFQPTKITSTKSVPEPTSILGTLTAIGIGVAMNKKKIAKEEVDKA
ncbi:MAG: PEP-CTERM sorting domain-containing protein [Symploca sp. SIO2E6]|nr:PEP-CTERM sorting domain-containing protein [Symploca sp. SIO2E6]